MQTSGIPEEVRVRVMNKNNAYHSLIKYGIIKVKKKKKGDRKPY